MPKGPWGFRAEEDQRATGGVTVSSPPPRQFACERCGAVLSYQPGTTELVCSYCGHRNRIREAPVDIVEQALAPALAAYAGEPPPTTPVAAKCGACGADAGNLEKISSLHWIPALDVVPDVFFLMGS